MGLPRQVGQLRQKSAPAGDEAEAATRYARFQLLARPRAPFGPKMLAKRASMDDLNVKNHAILGMLVNVSIISIRTAFLVRSWKKCVTQ